MMELVVAACTQDVNSLEGPLGFRLTSKLEARSYELPSLEAYNGPPALTRAFYEISGFRVQALALQG